MVAELLGLVRARSASGKTLIVETHDHNALRGERGFTAIELMVSVAIVGVLSAIAAPALMTMIQTQRVKSATFDLYAAVTYARSEAIKRNAVVTITPRAGGFANGYDLTTAGGVILKSHLGSPAVTVVAPGGGAAAAFAFDGYGRLTPSASYQLELTSTQSSTTPKRCLVISPVGRPSIRVDNDHDLNCING
jgi:type IV fimbrial biogenesis protein FimT